jgi:hypothetical protein
MAVELVVKDSISPELYRLAKRADTLQPVMRRVKDEILDPMVAAAWSASGLQSRSGSLLAAITAWHGRSSAGVTLKAKGGRADVGRVFAKAATHSRGAKKFSFKQGYYRSKKGGRKKSSILKAKRRSPWGDIPAREFFPEEEGLERKKSAIVNMIMEHLQNA